MSRKSLVKILIAATLLLGVWNLIPKLLHKERPAYTNYMPYLDEIRESFAHEMFTEHHLIFTGERGKMHETVEEAGFKFKSSRRCTLEEARALQLLVMDKLVQAFNNHTKIQPYLEERPFTYKRVTISISFEGSNGRYADSVGWVHNVPESAGVVENKNRLFYYVLDPMTGKNVDIHNETYEEAARLAIVSAQNYHRNTAFEDPER